VEFNPQQGQGIFLLASASRLALRLTQPPIQWVLGVLYLRVKYSWGMMLTTDPYLMLRSRVSRSYTSSPPKFFQGTYWDSFTLIYRPKTAQVHVSMKIIRYI
jgi:hypothetical protein